MALQYVEPYRGKDWSRAPPAGPEPLSLEVWPPDDGCAVNQNRRDAPPAGIRLFVLGGRTASGRQNRDRERFRTCWSG